jgi:uncharacterized FlaG/YvyC family protein
LPVLVFFLKGIKSGSEVKGMNIRTVTNPIQAIDAIRNADNKTVRMNESDADRDASGRREHSEPDQSPLNQDEFEKAKKYLEELESLKASGFTAHVDAAGDLRVFLIKDRDGNIVRRIPEHEMRQLITDKDRKSGQIFHKAG